MSTPLLQAGPGQEQLICMWMGGRNPDSQRPYCDPRDQLDGKDSCFRASGGRTTGAQEKWAQTHVFITAMQVHSLMYPPSPVSEATSGERRPLKLLRLDLSSVLEQPFFIPAAGSSVLVHSWGTRISCSMCKNPPLWNLKFYPSSSALNICSFYFSGVTEPM